MTYDDLIVTHNTLRSVDTYYFFRKRLRETGLFMDRPVPIYAIQTEDGKLYLTDGHHEMTAAYAEGIPFPIHKMCIQKYTYDEINTINLSQWYVTPYDPRSHVRKDNFRWFKNAIQQIYENNQQYGKLWAINAINDYKKFYLENRQIHSLKDMRDKYAVPNLGC